MHYKIDAKLCDLYNINMSILTFEWDENKNKTNQKKHGVSFEEAKTVFYDNNALLIEDPEHSLDENRFILLGFSYYLEILTVCHCYRSDDSVIRIISARKATRNEARTYSKRR